MAWNSLLVLVCLTTVTLADIYNQQVIRLDPPDDNVYIQGDSNVIEVIGGTGSNIIVQGDFNEFSQLDGVNIHTINGANNRVSFRGTAGNHTITLTGSGNGVNFEGGHSKVYMIDARDSNVTLRGEILLQLQETCANNDVTVVEGRNDISILGELNELTVLGGDNAATLSGVRHSVRLEGGSTGVVINGDESEVWVVDDATSSVTLIGSRGVIHSNAAMSLGVRGNENIIVLERGYSQVNVTGDRNRVNYDAGEHILIIDGTYNDISASNIDPTLDITVDGLNLQLGLPLEEPASFEYGGNTIRLPWEILSAETQPQSPQDNTGIPNEVTTPTLSNQAGAGEDYVTPTRPNQAPNNNNNNGGGYQTPTWAPFFTPSRRVPGSGGSFTTPGRGDLQPGGGGGGVGGANPFVTPSQGGDSGDNRAPLVTPRRPETNDDSARSNSIDRLQARGSGGAHLTAWGKPIIALSNLFISMTIVWLMTSPR